MHGWYCFAYWDRFYPGQSVRRIRIQRPVSVCTAWGLWTAPASPGLPTYVQGAYFVYTIWYTITAHATGSWGRRCALMIAHDQHSSSPLPMGLPGLSARLDRQQSPARLAPASRSSVKSLLRTTIGSVSVCLNSAMLSLGAKIDLRQESKIHGRGCAW